MTGRSTTPTGQKRAAEEPEVKERILSTQRKALLCILLSSAIFIVWGSYIAAGSYAGLGDLKAVFYATRCLMQHVDPYNPSVLLQVYQADGHRLPTDPSEALLFRVGMMRCVNLPTSLFLLTPLALLPWSVAGKVWMVVSAALLTLTALLVWTVAKDRATRASAVLICLILCNSELIFAIGNLAVIGVTLCIFAVWCFLEERFVRAGIVCLAVSLVLKPHDAALVWFYFLLAGGSYRKRALQTIGVAAALTIPAILWVSSVTPHWMQELHSNLVALGARGSVNDPGPDSLTFHSAGSVISLQSTFSLIRDDPRFYNLAAYLITGSLLIAGAFRVLKSRFTKQNAWFALAAIAALSMLPVYHRSNDAKLLLLTVPACAVLWAEGGRLKWIAGLVTTAAIACVADVPAMILVMTSSHVQHTMSGDWQRVLMVLLRPAAPVLLAAGIFYLWVYFRRTAEERRETAEVSERLAASVPEFGGARL